MSPETNVTVASTVSIEPILTPELLKTLQCHDQIRWKGETGPFKWNETYTDWNSKTTVKPRSVHLVKNKIYTLGGKPFKESHSAKSWNLYFYRLALLLEEKDLSNWALVKIRHEEVLLEEKKKRAWTAATRVFPKVRSQFVAAVQAGKSRLEWDLKDLEISKKIELLTKLTPSELGLLEFLEKDSKNPEEDIKKLFEVYYLYTSQQNNEKSV